MCQKDCLDDACCSMRDKAIFLTAWSLAHAIYLIIDEMGMFWTPSSFTGWAYYANLAFVVVVVICQVLGTIFLFIGIYKEMPIILKLGLILCLVYAFVQFFTANCSSHLYHNNFQIL